MKNIIFLIAFISSTLCAFSQNGTYSVTNSDDYTSNSLKIMIFKMLQSNLATLTVENESNPSMKPDDIDTNFVVEIVSDITKEQCSSNEIANIILGIPSQISIDDEKILILGNQNDTIKNLPITKKNYKDKKQIWIFQCAGDTKVELAQKTVDTYILRVPDITALTLKKN